MALFLHFPFYYRVQQREQILQFSKQPIMDNFGELPFGEIPEPLKYTRPFRKYFLVPRAQFLFF